MCRRGDSASSTPSAGRRACQPSAVRFGGMRAGLRRRRGCFGPAIARPPRSRPALAPRRKADARSCRGGHRAVHCMPFDNRPAKMSRRQDGPRQHVEGRGRGADPRADAAERTASQCRPALVRPPLRPPPCPSRQWRGRRPSAAGGEVRGSVDGIDRTAQSPSVPPAAPAPMFY